MKNKNLYDKTVSILVQAYLNDTLTHGHCTSCAVGNMIASCNGYEMKGDSGFFLWEQRGKSISSRWGALFLTVGGEQRKRFQTPDVEAIRECISTGYSVNDLAKIEYAFETAPKGNSDDEWMFNGLMAVVDVLDEIHGNKDADTTAATKQKFKRVAV